VAAAEEWRELYGRIRDGDEIPEAALSDMIDLAQFRLGVETTLDGSAFDWMLMMTPGEFLAQAWQSTLCQAAGKCRTGNAAQASNGRVLPNGFRGIGIGRSAFDFALDGLLIPQETEGSVTTGPTIATPGNEGTQRIARSGRCQIQGTSEECEARARLHAEFVGTACQGRPGYESPEEAERVAREREAAGEIIIEACVDAEWAAWRATYCTCRCESLATCQHIPFGSQREKETPRKQ
jgi:hypothetical protein